MIRVVRTLDALSAIGATQTEKRYWRDMYISKLEEFAELRPELSRFPAKLAFEISESNPARAFYLAYKAIEADPQSVWGYMTLKNMLTNWNVETIREIAADAQIGYVLNFLNIPGLEIAKANEFYNVYEGLIVHGFTAKAEFLRAEVSNRLSEEKTISELESEFELARTSDSEAPMPFMIFLGQSCSMAVLILGIQQPCQVAMERVESEIPQVEDVLDMAPLTRLSASIEEKILKRESTDNKMLLARVRLFQEFLKQAQAKGRNADNQ